MPRSRPLSPKTVTNHLTFLHGLFALALRGAGPAQPVAMVDRSQNRWAPQRSVADTATADADAAASHTDPLAPDVDPHGSDRDNAAPPSTREVPTQTDYLANALRNYS